MEEDGSSSSSSNNKKTTTGIRQIVRLKQLLQKWQSVTISSPADIPDNLNSHKKSPGGISPAISKRLSNTTNMTACDSDEETGCQSPEHPVDVPKGYLAVYVGPTERRRFIIPTSYLSHSLFKVLLEKVEEEFGFDCSGGLTIPCEIETFKYLLKCMESQQNDDNPEDTAGEVED